MATIILITTLNKLLLILRIMVAEVVLLYLCALLWELS